MDATATASNNWLDEQRGKTAEIPCQNCGRLVLVSLPFIGCVFCSSCIIGDSGWNDGSEDFYKPR